MADFLSDFGGSLGDKVLPNGDALKRKIDSNRETWLKGISSTKHGKKEDPTYLHFRFIFDFGSTAALDPETFLAPSPLFRPIVDTKESQQELTNLAGDIRGYDKDNLKINDPEYVNALGMIGAEDIGSFYSDTDFFYGSKFLINSRAERGAFNINGGGVGYMGAQQFLKQRSIKRQQMLNAFRNGLRFINEKCPYYFQSIGGLDQLLKVDIKNFHKAGSKPQRAGTLTVDCMESIDMRIFALSELYRKAIYDYTYHRVMLPENLRKFRMWLVVSEIRNIQLTYGMNDVLNPFSIPSVAKGANFLDSFNSQSGLLDNTQGLLQKSTNPNMDYQDKFGSYTLGPYAFIYQFDQCEFDFDESYPSYSSIDNKGGSAVTNKFKIHVGRVKDYKIQFNELSDVIQKKDNIKQMVLSDVWGSKLSKYNDYDYAGSEGIESVDFSDKANPSEYFAQLASNFITNSVADLKDQGVQLLEGALLGNIYGLGGTNVGAATRSAQSLVNTLKDGIPNPFKDNTPQGQGLGGPGQRQYPTVNEDVYPGVPGASQENLGTAYNGGTGSTSTLNEDIYPTNPGPDLGVPDRQYPKPGGDAYKNVPGSDLGVPGRIYPTVNGDVYNNVPGSDLGVPDRQYPSNNDDEYNNVPGPDLGVPNRIYPDINSDVYPTAPGADLGVPDRQYPGVNEDVYPDPTQISTDNIGKIYPDSNNEYSNVNEKEYTEGIKTQVNNIGDVYPESTVKYPGVNDSEYQPNIQLDNKLRGDVYPDVPGKDLGVPGRNYGSLNDKEYNQSTKPINTNIGRIYPSNKNENNS